MLQNYITPKIMLNPGGRNAYSNQRSPELNQLSKPAAVTKSPWSKLQAAGCLVILIASLPALRAGVDPMAYQVAALVLIPFLAGLGLLWFFPRTGTVWLGVAGLVLALLLAGSPALLETEAPTELLAAWAALLGAILVAGASIPAMRALGRRGS
jgi:hypothetical protein